MSFLSSLKNIFSRKKEEMPSPEMERPTEPLIDEEPLVVKEEAKPPEERKERKCPFCGAPNDTFVSTCWMCKKKI